MWTCTKCGCGVRRKVSAEMNDQCRQDVTCARAQRGACETRRAKWSQKQSAATVTATVGASDAQSPPQTGDKKQVPSPAAHVPESCFGKRGGGGRTLRQAHQPRIDPQTGPRTKVEGENLLMTATRSDSRSSNPLREKSASHRRVQEASEEDMTLGAMADEAMGTDLLSHPPEGQRWGV